MLKRASLSLDDARFIAKTVVDTARQRGFAVCVAVTDSTTFVQCHLRMDGAPLFAVQGALDKSASTSEGGMPTTHYDKMLKDGRVSVLRLPQVPCPGGIPVVVDGCCVGAVGVAGAPPHIDIELAEGAVDAFLSARSGTERLGNTEENSMNATVARRDQPADKANRTSTFKISETILRTSRLDDMKTWYRQVLGVDTFFEHAPTEDTKTPDGRARPRLCFFRLSLDYPYVQTIGIFEEPGTAPAAAEGSPGLHHMQLMAASIADLCNKYEELLGHGVRPHRASNHGPITSFYYRDPDGNNVEVTAQNFPSLEAMDEFMASAAFKANPSGAAIDPGDFVRQFRSGVPVAELIRL